MAPVDADVDLILSHIPITYYSGPIGGPKDWQIRQIAARLHAMVPHPTHHPDRCASERFHTIYTLRHSYSKTVVYVGKTWNVADRFDAHRRRDWWHYVDSVNLDLVSCSHEGECDQLDRAALLVENAAIGLLRPLANRFIPTNYLGSEAVH